MEWICPICDFPINGGKSVTAKCCHACGALLVGRRRMARIRQAEAARHAISEDRQARRAGVSHG